MSAPASAVEAALAELKTQVETAFPDDFRAVETEIGVFRPADLATRSVAAPACLLHAVRLLSIARLGDGRVDAEWLWFAGLVHDPDTIGRGPADAERFGWWLANWRPPAGLSVPSDVEARSFGEAGAEERRSEQAQGITLWGFRWRMSVRYGALPVAPGVIPTRLYSTMPGDGAPTLIYRSESS